MLVAIGGCVVIDDPKHCWNREGDATCVDIYGEGSVCSRCLRGFNGCSDERDAPVPLDCRAVDVEDESTTSLGPTESGSSAGIPECVGQGLVEGCPAETPYCADGTCSDCTAAGGDPYCAGLDGSAPVCHPGWGYCVGCVDDDACGGSTPFCGTSFECGGCTSHEQCPESACDFVDGTCMDPDVELWIDDEDCDDNATGLSAAGPLCSLVEAETRVAAGQRAIFHLASGYYDGIDLQTGCTGRRIAVLGAGAGSVVHGPDGVGGAVRLVCSSENALYLYRMTLYANDGAAVFVDAPATVRLDRTLIRQGEPGLDIDGGAHVTLARTRVLESVEHGIIARSGARLVLDSTIIANTTGGGLPSALLVAGGDVEIRFSTFVANEGDLGSIRCSGGTSGTVHDSLFASSVDASSIGCPFLVFEHNLVDESEVEGSDNTVRTFDEAWFVDAGEADYRLSENARELAGIAQWDLGDPRTDFEGDARATIPGTASYPGADQP